MESLKSAQSKAKTPWLLFIFLTLVVLLILALLACSSVLTFAALSTGPVESAQAGQVGGEPTPVQIGEVKPTAVPATATPIPPAPTATPVPPAALSESTPPAPTATPALPAALSEPTPIVGSAYASLIPDLDVPAGLFFPDKGDSNFDPTAGRALYAKGDWIVYANLMESILPVPSGWKTVETGQDTYIVYSPVEDWEQPAIRIRLTVYGYEDDATTSAMPVTEFVDQVKEVPTYSLLKQELLDDNTGYVFGAMSTESGKKRYLLQVFSKYAYNPAGKFFHVYSVFTDQADWAAYYPLIRAMLANWHALDNTPIAVSLPDTLTQ